MEKGGRGADAGKLNILFIFPQTRCSGRDIQSIQHKSVSTVPRACFKREGGRGEKGRVTC